jgi:dynamin 1-like protein
MVLKYASDENTIILAVSAANFDIAGSESLEIAKKVDPDGTSYCFFPL